MAPKGKQNKRRRAIARNGNFFRSVSHNIWKINQLIGSGGMADVYAAVSETVSGGPYVLKTGVGGDMAQERNVFARHLKAADLDAAQVQFGHAIRLPRLVDHGVQPETNLFFVVMEHMQPETAVAPLADGIFLQLLIDLLGALKYLQFVGLVHGDIKSDNILKKNGHFYLADFGITVPPLRESMRHLNRDKYVDGTLEYAGRDMHLTGIGSTFRCDLDNLIFVMLQWAQISLPWKEECYPPAVFQQKVAFLERPQELLKLADSPLKATIIRTFVGHTMALSPPDTVDYNKLLSSCEAAKAGLVRRDPGRRPVDALQDYTAWQPEHRQADWRSKAPNRRPDYPYYRPTSPDYRAKSPEPCRRAAPNRPLNNGPGGQQPPARLPTAEDQRFAARAAQPPKQMGFGVGKEQPQLPGAQQKQMAFGVGAQNPAAPSRLRIPIQRPRQPFANPAFNALRPDDRPKQPKVAFKPPLPPCNQRPVDNAQAHQRFENELKRHQPADRQSRQRWPRRDEAECQRPKPVDERPRPRHNVKALRWDEIAAKTGVDYRPPRQPEAVQKEPDDADYDRIVQQFIRRSPDKQPDDGRRKYVRCPGAADDDRRAPGCRGPRQSRSDNAWMSTLKPNDVVILAGRAFAVVTSTRKDVAVIGFDSTLNRFVNANGRPIKPPTCTVAVQWAGPRIFIAPDPIRCTQCEEFNAFKKELNVSRDPKARDAIWALKRVNMW